MRSTSIKPRNRSKSFLTSLLASLTAFAILGIWLELMDLRGTAQPQPASALKVSIDGHRVDVRWKPEERTFRTALGGLLTIQDGSRTRTIPLTSAELHSNPGITYLPSTDIVRVMFEASGANGKKQSQSVLAILTPAQNALGASPPPAQEAQREDSRMNVPDERRRRLVEFTSIKSDGVGIKNGRYIPPRPRRETRPELTNNLAALVLGTVEIEVRVKINARGRVVDAMPVSQTGSLQGSAEQRAAFAHAALGAARKWSFVPAKIDFRPVASEIIISFRFAHG